MAAEKKKLTLSKETLRTLSATALGQVAGGSGYTAPGPTGTCGWLYGCSTYNCNVPTSGEHSCLPCYV